MSLNSLTSLVSWKLLTCMVTEEHLGLACAPARLLAGSWCQERAVCSYTESTTRHLVLLAEFRVSVWWRAGSLKWMRRGLRCENSWQCLSWRYQQHQHACMQITAWGLGQHWRWARFKCTDPAISARCVFCEPDSVCTDSSWAGGDTPQGRGRCSCGEGNPLCIPDPHGLQGDESHHFSSLPPFWGLGCCLWVFLTCVSLAGR